MFRSLTQSILGNTRARRAIYFGVLGTTLAGGGFGLTQIFAPAGNADSPQTADSEQETTAVAAAEATQLAPIPGDSDAQVVSTAQESPAAASPATASDIPQNPYVQAQYTDQVPVAGTVSDGSVTDATPPATTIEVDAYPPADGAAPGAPASIPTNSLPDLPSSQPTTANPTNIPPTVADGNPRHSLIDPPPPIPATMPAESAPLVAPAPLAATPLAAGAGLTDSASATTSPPTPQSGGSLTDTPGSPSESAGGYQPNAYQPNPYQPNAYQPAAGNPAAPVSSPATPAAQPLSSDGSTPQPLAPTEFVPLPTTGAPQLPGSVTASAPPATPGGLEAAPQATGALPAAVPGARKLEGLQTPSVTIEKSAPSEVQVGQPATFEILVKNVGQATAHHVLVQDVVPAKTRYAGAEPEATTDGNGTYTWQIAQLAPGEEQLIKLHVVPEAEGEIGSIAQVSFQAQASVRTVSTQPRLKITYEGPAKVLIGDDVALRLTISNEGSGAANHVSVAADVPAGLSHPSGTQLELENAIPVLLPDEKRSFELILESNQAGTVICPIQDSASGQQPVTKQHQVEVVAPQMQLAMQGPVRRYLERNATFTIQLGNAGTAPATNVELVARLPQGLEFIEADKKGEYDAREHAVYWFLDQLPINQRGAVQLRTLPVETGLQTVDVSAEADLNTQAEVKHQLQVESLAELIFSVSDTADPIETGTETTYVISVKNHGDKPDSNVRVVATLPPGLAYVSSSGPTQAQGQQPAAGQTITFAPLASLGAQERVEYRIQVQGVSEGDQKLRVTLQSDEVQRALVMKEESTRVYRDDR